MKTWKKEEVRDKLLTFLEETIDDTEATRRDKLSAVKLMGTEFGMFIEQKKINIDVNTVVRHLTDAQLKELVGGDYDSTQNQSMDSVGYLDTDFRLLPADNGVFDGDSRDVNEDNR